jgi:hypothetical protein
VRADVGQHGQVRQPLGLCQQELRQRPGARDHELVSGPPLGREFGDRDQRVEALLRRETAERRDEHRVLAQARAMPEGGRVVRCGLCEGGGRQPRIAQHDELGEPVGESRPADRLGASQEPLRRVVRDRADHVGAQHVAEQRCRRAVAGVLADRFEYVAALNAVDD